MVVSTVIALYTVPKLQKAWTLPGGFLPPPPHAQNPWLELKS